MPRPLTDIDAGRELLLATVEEMVRARGATDISMTDLAAEAGMSPSNLYRYFSSKEALFEAVAERWFADKVAIMEEVVASELPIREKFYSFFARRFVLLRARFNAEPNLFRSYCELGQQHIEVVKGHIDLGDHYLSIIVADAMEQGHFAGLTIDETVSLINQMAHVYINPDALLYIPTRLSEEKLSLIIDAMLSGLKRQRTNLRILA